MPLLSGTSLHYFQRRKPSQLREIPRENKVDPCATRSSFSFSLKNLAAVPSSVSRSNSWKSGKVCVSRRFTTMGVKVGGVETQEPYRRLDLRICGSGFREAFNCCWEKKQGGHRVSLKYTKNVEDRFSCFNNPLSLCWCLKHMYAWNSSQECSKDLRNAAKMSRLPSMHPSTAYSMIMFITDSSDDYLKE